MDTSDVDERAKLLRSLSLERVREEPGSPANGLRYRWLGLVGLGVTCAVIGAVATRVAMGSGPDTPSGSPETTGESGIAASPSPGEDARSGLVASGYVVARNEATVAAEITGRIVEIRFEEGQAVARGQILAVLDQSVIDADVTAASARAESSRSAINSLRAELVEARATLQRAEALDSRGFIAKADLGRIRAEVASLEARVSSAEADAKAAGASLRSLRSRAAQYYVRAPFSGIVVDKNAQVGEIISPISAGGGFTRTGIGTLVDMTSLEVEVDVNEQYVERIREGQRVTVSFDAYPNMEATARVIAMVPAVDRARSTVRVRIGFAELDQRFIPNLSVKVRFHTDPAAPGN